MLDHNTLSNMIKKTNESFSKYVIKWRKQVAWVKQELDEKELVNLYKGSRYRLLPPHDIRNGKTISHNNQNWINGLKWS